MKLYELKRGSSFKFKGDVKEEKYWFGRIDGAYGQVFKTKQDMEDFKDATYVNASSDIENSDIENIECQED